MRPSVRAPVHRPFAGAPATFTPPESEDEATKFVDRPCYLFNRILAPSFDDRHCMHCRHYLTARCPHIDEFLDDVEDLAPD